MWKSLFERIFGAPESHPLERHPRRINDHPLGEQVGLVLLQSKEEAKRLQHFIIESEHLLLALTKYPVGFAQQALSELHVDSEKVEALIPDRVSQSDLPPGAFRVSTQTDAIFQRASDEARYFKRSQIASEHILLALMQFETAMAYRILQQLNVTPERLREKVYALADKAVELDGPQTRKDPQKAERFTKRVRQVLAISQQIAEQRHDRFIGVEYLMIALVREGGGVAARSLRELGVTSEKLETILYLRMKRQPLEKEFPDLSPQVKRTLELAVDEARRLRHHYIGTEHLLLGLTRQKDLLPMQALEQLGITVDELRAKVKTVMAQPPTSA